MDNRPRTIAVTVAGTILLAVVVFALANSTTGRASPVMPAQPASDTHRPASSLLEPFSPLDQPVWGPDVRVNSRPSPSPTSQLAIVRNYSLAVNPTNPDNVIASYDNQEFSIYNSGYSYSTDGGRSWSSGIFTGPWGDQAMGPIGFTDVGFDAQGIGYYTSLAISNTMSGYFVLTTTTGASWSTPVPVVVSDPNESRYYADLVVDRRSSGPYAGSLYMFWLYTNNINPYYHGIWLRYSRDGGRTWSNDVPVSDPDHIYGRGTSGAVAPNGWVYAAFEQTQDNYIANSPELYVARSTDGGLTWGGDHMVTGAPITKIGIPDFKGRELVLLADSSCSMIRINHFPSLAVSPTDPNTLYVVWNDGRWDQQFTACAGTGRHSDIAFSRSTDGGLTWSAPVRLNDDPAGNGIDQFQPTIAVRQDGTIGVTWYDRRYSVDGYLYDLAYTQSTDGGLTWSANQRVSDTSSDANNVPDYKGIDDLGYRKALEFAPYNAYYVLAGWMDTEEGGYHGNFYADRGQFPTPSPTPFPTLTSTATPMPTHTSTVTPTSTPALTATPTPCTISFSDVPPDYVFYPYIRCLYCRGIIGGYSDGTFRPGNPTTRGQMSKIVANAAGILDPIPPGTQTYTDVPPSHPFWVYIERLSAHGIVGGYSDGTFRPDNWVTRGQLTKFASNAAGFSEPIPSNQQTYTDVPPSQTFWLYIERLSSRGIISGYQCGVPPAGPCDPQNRPYFLPDATITRGQTSKIVANTFFPDCRTP